MPPQFTPQNRRTGATLRALREGVGLTQDDVVEQVARAGGRLSKTALSDYESGQRRPSNGALMSILEVIASELHARAVA